MTAFLFVALAAAFALADRALIKKGQTHETTDHSDRVTRRGSVRAAVGGRRSWYSTKVNDMRGTRVGTVAGARALLAQDRRASLPPDDQHAVHALLGLSCDECPHPIADRRAR